MTRTSRYLADAARAFERAPVEVVTVIVLAVAFSYAVDAGDEAFRGWIEVAVGGLLILAAAWTGTLLHGLGAWSTRTRWAGTAAGAVVAAACAMLVLDLELVAEAWRAFMLVTAAVLWLVAVPAFAARRGAAAAPPAGDEVGLTRTVNGRILLRVIGALLYGGALFAGLALAIGAVNTLFELGLRGEIYAHVFGWIVLVLAPWIVIGGLPDYVHPIDGSTSAVAPVVHRMTAFLVPPLLAVYCLILYAYAVRIAITGEVPKNLVSPMVLAAGVLMALALFLFDGEGSGRDTGGRGMLRWLRYAPPLFIPLALLGAWALWQRVDQYGWTEFRLLRMVVLVMFAGFAIAATVLLLRRRRYPLHLVPLTFAGVLVLSAVGPWSVLALSRQSQYTRLVDRLEEVGIDAQDTAAPTSPRTVSAEAYEQINSTARYLATHFGPDALPAVLAARVEEQASVHDLAASLRLDRQWPQLDDVRGFGAQLAGGTSLSVGGMTVHRVILTPQPGGMTSGAVAVQQDSTRLTFTVAGETLYADLGDIGEQARGGTLAGEDARLDVTAADGTRRGDLLILVINLHVEAGQLRMRQLDGLLFVHG